ncbi:D-glycero-alpha-D-manno-heptose-1,7-bisphosphate 7-phosphatase [Paracidobacterium acidisoli]|uniref:D-glycero-alpha-D-manno-heptose-1,7-bisphosphate 7-phosphatase n=1 Tax=Paracidobacterium acidisoli TaxID=2303751 RepID=UPI003315A172
MSAKSPFHNIDYVFLDRDGVINQKPPEGEYISCWDRFHFLPLAEAAIAGLNRSGRRIIVVTNQRGVALGLYSEAGVQSVHIAMRHHLAAHGARIDAVYYCPHDKNQCDCRKPGTAMFEQAFHDFPGASAANSVMIGDSLSDIEAARRLHMPSIFIEGDPEKQKPGAEKAALLADATASSLAEAVRRYLI